MQIDQLQIELRPRSHAQALDLGFALLRSHAGEAYKAFLALWLPLIALCALLTVWLPHLWWLWLIAAWWLRPLLERAPLYVLSRQVFGATVSWQEAVRAWPRQLGGGTWRLLVWGRIVFASGRALMQPVWQLEMARGRVASTRQRVLGANGTGMAAFWFGVVCLVLESVLQLGLVYFVITFASDGDAMAPFKYLFNREPSEVTDTLLRLMWLSAYAVAAAIMAPIYTACGFTLYLNRRASLEAWDLELQLRQMTRPPAVKARSGAAQALSLAVACVLLASTLSAAPPAHAQAPAAAKPATGAATPKNTCVGPKLELAARPPAANNDQALLRKQLDQVYAHPDLRGFECAQVWQLKPRKDTEKKPRETLNLSWLDFLASVFKVIFIAFGIGVVAYLLYRYRDHFPAFARRPGALRATEVGGLDIRAESLPPDVTAQVRALWARGERRLALALLYRATLSRLVSDDNLTLRQGDTEGDCLRTAGVAAQAARLSQPRMDVARAATNLWLNGAYGDRWPDDAVLNARCAEWDSQFDAAGEQRA